MEDTGNGCKEVFSLAVSVQITTADAAKLWDTLAYYLSKAFVYAPDTENLICEPPTHPSCAIYLDCTFFLKKS